MPAAHVLPRAIPILSGPTSAPIDGEREALISGHLYLVEQIARRLHRRLPRMIQLDDLRSDGALGLLSAARHYDPWRGISFATFASHRIRGSIIDGLRERDPSANSRRARMRNEAKAGVGRNDKSPFAGPASAGMPPPLPRFCSLQTVVRNEPTARALRSRIPRPEQRFEIRDLLATLLRRLPANARRMIYFKWIKELSQKDLARRWGVSQARISTRHTRAMQLLRRSANVRNEANGRNSEC